MQLTRQSKDLIKLAFYHLNKRKKGKPLFAASPSKIAYRPVNFLNNFQAMPTARMVPAMGNAATTAGDRPAVILVTTPLQSIVMSKPHIEFNQERISVKILLVDQTSNQGRRPRESPAIHNAQLN
jgi:hypothetical protein